ncbi:MAG: M20/M25/M40 family metallo-hydrolase [Planctomycetota bacterium]|jgi:hypothetical protein
MSKPTRTISVLLLLLLAAPPLVAEEETTHASVRRHDLAVRFDLAGHRLVAEDALSVEAGDGGGLLVLDLAPQLEVLALAVGDEERAAPERGEDGVFEVPVPAGESRVRVHYAGEIFDAVQEADTLSWVVGDDTTGVISEEGIYLSGASRWIPRPLGRSMARYDITTYVPEPFYVVTQGGNPETEVITGDPAIHASTNVVPWNQNGADPHRWRMAHWPSVLPTDGVSLSGGPFVVKSRDVEGVRISTYFFESEAGDADLWLDAAEEVVQRYVDLLGPYPHPRFDIVENFFQTGYGMPAWTLLGNRVIQYVTGGAKRSGGGIPPGYLDHEYVHGWYGNGLFVDYETGNWCEALTTYFTNYLAVELKEGEEAARDYRRGVMEKFAIRVRPEDDYPLRAFQGKTEDKDNDIGYGKGSLVFHLIRRELGDEAFFATVKAFTQARIGTVVSWDDWLQAFDDATEEDLTPYVLPWLERPGLPFLAIKSLEVLPVEGDPDAANLAFRIRHGAPGDTSPFWPVRFDLRTTWTTGDTHDDTRDVRPENIFDGMSMGSILTAGQPTSIAIDPDYHLPRRIADDDLPHCLNRTLAAPGDGIVQWSGAEALLKPLAERFARQKGFTVVGADHDVSAHEGPAVILEIAAEGDAAIEVGGRARSGAGIAVLRSYAEDGHLRARYTALSEQAAARAGYIPFYGWDTWVVFENGRPVDRGTVRPEQTGTQRRLAAAPAAPPPAPGGAVDRIRADLERLCSAELEGRRPGTEGHRRATAFLEARVEEALEPLFEVDPRVPGPQGWFVLGVPERRSGRGVHLDRDGEVSSFPDAFRPFCFSTSREDAWSLPVGDGPGHLVLHAWSGTDVRELWNVVVNTRDDAGGLAFVLTEEAEKALAPWLDTPADLTATSEAELARPGRNGRPRPRPALAPWISGRRARGGLTTWWDAGVPVIALSQAEGERLSSLRGTGTRVVFSVEFDAAWEQVASNLPGGMNVAGVKVPSRGTRELPPVVVVTAHYDALGHDGDRFFPGADDNASGVACLLELLRQIETKEDSRVAVGVCFTDAEEWGLVGARSLVENLGLLDVRAVINVDSIGRAASQPTHVIGLSTHPDLANRVAKRLEEQGLEVGRDIDRFAYAHGSDHYPIHERGIPAVSIWATDYQVMNSVGDTLEHVEPEGIAKIAAALRTLIFEDLDAIAGDEPLSSRDQ